MSREQITSAKRIVIKIGSSSLTGKAGSALDAQAVNKLVDVVAACKKRGAEVVVVSSGAIAAGLAPLGLTTRPKDLATQQAAASVGQGLLVAQYTQSFARHSITASQVLLTTEDVVRRSHYQNAQRTLYRLLQLGVVPIINENDSVGTQEIRFGDNDHISALLSHLLKADVLILLTDIDGLYTSDPRTDVSATLVTDVFEGDPLMSVDAGSSSSNRGSGGMASKLSAARIASWSGVRAVIAQAQIESVLNKIVAGPIAGTSTIGTTFHGSDRHLSSRQLWVAFASEVRGRVVVDGGAALALRGQAVSLLPAGVVGATGEFEVVNTVEVIDPDGGIIARGSSLMSVQQVQISAGRRTADLDEHFPQLVIHRDGLVILPS